MYFRKFLVVMIALLNLPSITNAGYQISPNPNPKNNTIIVNTSDAVNQDTFQNYGTVQIEYPNSILTNSGQFENYSGATLSIYIVSALNNSGQLINYGNVKMDTGTLNSSGTWSNYGSLTSNEGEVYNSGQLQNYSGASMNFLWGGIRNSGTITNSGSMSFYYGTILNYGMLINNAGLEFVLGSATVNSGSMTNSGSMNFNGAYRLDSGFINNGTLTNYGTMRFSSIGMLTNSGTLTNYGTMRFSEIGWMTNSGTLRNDGTIIGDILSEKCNNYKTYTQSTGQTINNGSMTNLTIAINGGSLSGTGTITGDVTIASGALLKPGDSLGTFTIIGTLVSGGDIYFEISGLNNGQYDVLNINGNATFNGGKVEFDFINGFNAKAGDYWNFLLADSLIGWETLNLAMNGLGDGLDWEIVDITGGKQLLITRSQPVPEPATMLLFGVGLLGVAGLKRRVQ